MQDIKRSVGVLIYFIFYIYTAFLPLFYRFFKKSGAKNFTRLLKKSRTKKVMFKLTTYNIEIICILNIPRVPATQADPLNSPLNKI